MRSYSHLSEDERDQIGVLRAAGRSMGAIARALGRAKATISREVQRNALPSSGHTASRPASPMPVTGEGPDLMVIPPRIEPLHRIGFFGSVGLGHERLLVQLRPCRLDSRCQRD
jgi:hypothetical protein